MPRIPGFRPAFTLVELLVVIGIIATLMAILLPVLGTARESAKSLTCLSNLRQLAIAAQFYCNNNGGRYPVAQWKTVNPGPPAIVYNYAWDFTTVVDAGVSTIEPGLLWEGNSNFQIQQCPSFDGKSNTSADPYTGYNYNTSYIGHGKGEFTPEPIKASQVLRPAECVLFGDGQYSSGANKYMRAPFPNPGDSQFVSRAAGTQGYRHRGRTNIVYTDGHAESWKERHTATTPTEIPKLTPTTGFLSEDNSMYDPQWAQ